ncbi:MAG: D-alanyl-D-alanine carboxypeptidase family protein [Coriobacteriales bacterium]|nr:D-alanyl-D-alanine carboxypeptidase family protein [Coriobacteriales bacterium]
MSCKTCMRPLAIVLCSICALAFVRLCVLVPQATLAAQIDSEPELEEAEGAALLDTGGNVLYAYNEEERFPPASTTKVMTAMVALDSGRSLDEMVTIREDDLGEGGQLADYGDGDQVPLGELMQVMLVYSGNDAAYNTACHIAGSEEAFAKLMNAKAKEIGMTNTHFVNSHGMDVDDHYSCAKDLAIMGRYAMQHYPFICQTVVMEEAQTTVRGYPTVLKATDQLLGKFDGIRGVKSGAVADGYSFVGASGRGDVQLYSGVIGCKTPMGRFNDTATLMEWGYENFGEYTISNSSWVTRMQPYAYDFGYKVPLSAVQDVTCSLWPNIKDVSYKSVLVRPNALMGTNSICGWADWNQKGRKMGGALYGTHERPVRQSSWPLFVSALFDEPDPMGEGGLDEQ